MGGENLLVYELELQNQVYHLKDLKVHSYVANYLKNLNDINFLVPSPWHIPDLLNQRRLPFVLGYQLVSDGPLASCF